MTGEATGRELVLASASPRRLALLTQVGVPVFALQGGLSAMIKQIEKSAASEKPA